MSYFDNNGKSAGPIQIGSSGAVLNYNLIPLNEQTESCKYLTFSGTPHLNKANGKYYTDSNSLMCLRARTPNLGMIYKDTGVTPYADLNAVATVGWVMAYSTLELGDKSIDLSAFVDAAAFSLWTSRVVDLETHITSLQSSHDTLRSEFDIFKETVYNDYETKADANEKHQEFLTYVEEPFPDGVWLQCGNAT